MLLVSLLGLDLVQFLDSGEELDRDVLAVVLDGPLEVGVLDLVVLLLQDH